MLLRRGSSALTYNKTTGVVLCDMITSLPKLKSLKVPWSCPNASAIKSILWCQQRWTGISCNTKKLVISLTLGNQNLVGSIPHTLGLLTSLSRYLWINNNRISGTIPASLGNLTSLTSIRLDHNSLSGQVPRTLTRLSKLVTLNLNDNYLTGLLPTLSRVTYNDDGGGTVSSFTQLTHYPTSQPTGQPSSQPTAQPSSQPTSRPTGPTGQPTSHPTSKPSIRYTPSSQPTSEPSSSPSSNVEGPRAAAETNGKAKILSAGSITGAIIGSILGACILSLCLYCFVLPLICVAGPDHPSREAQPSEEESYDDEMDMDVPDDPDNTIRESDVDITI